VNLRVERVAAPVLAKAAPFLEAVAELAGANLHSLYLVGSAVTPDWHPDRSDINTLLVLRQMSLGVLESIAPLGQRFKGSGIAPPLLLDQPYLASSIDVFPMEFLELRLIHETVLGEDILAPLVIDRGDLRLQCEREVKSRLLGLRQSYLRSLGEPKALAEALVRFLSGYQPLARAVLVLLGTEPPLRRAAAFEALAAAVGTEAAVFVEMLAVKEGRNKPDAAAVRGLFERCHKATERLGQILDEHAG
jgi:hypothetical protein